MDIAEYHDNPAVGSSFIKAFLQSPLHAWAAYLDPDRKRPDKAAHKKGRAWHAAVFEPQHFDARYGVTPDAPPTSTRAMAFKLAHSDPDSLAKMRALPHGLTASSKAGKELITELQAQGLVPLKPDDHAWVLEQMATLRGKELLNQTAMDDVIAMARIAKAQPISRLVFETLASISQAEVSMFTEHRATGLDIKIRPDYLVTPCAQFPNGLVIDGKSCHDASKEGFGRAVWNYSYGLQAALYTSVAQQILETSGRPAFVWLAQESSAPYACLYHGAGDRLLQYWERKIEEVMPRIAECFTSGIWPGYSTGVEFVQLPGWAERILDAEEEEPGEVML